MLKPPAPPSHVVVFDVDGTLAPINRAIPAELQRPLGELQARASIVLASGKPCVYLAGFCRAADLDVRRTMLVGENGADIWLSAAVPPPSTLALPELCGTAAVEALQIVRQELVNRYGESLWFQPAAVAVTPFPSDLQVLSPRDLARAVRDILRTEAAPYGADIEVFVHPDSVDIVPAGVNKGVALAALFDALQFPAEEAYAVGDGSNDVPMFKAAGRPIAVGRRPEMLQLEAEGVPRFDTIEQVLAYLLRHIPEESGDSGHN